MAQLAARPTVDRCVFGSSPRGAEHFGPLQYSATGLGNQRPWCRLHTSVSMRVLGIGYKRSRATYR